MNECCKVMTEELGLKLAQMANALSTIKKKRAKTASGF
jgi:hypothetical protein